MSLVALVLSTVALTIIEVNAISALHPRQGSLLGNTSVLPPGWSGNSQCLADCVFNDTPLTVEFMFGPSFTDPVGLTIESCVAFCDQQGSRMAGLKGTECRCANIFNPSSCFESDGNECQSPEESSACPGNSLEACGLANGTPPLFNIFFNFVSQFSCSEFLWPGGAPLAPSGSWRFSYFYNDSPSARVLPHSISLSTPAHPQGSLTVEACLNACEGAGYTLAGVESGSACFCGNALRSNAQVVTDCSLISTNPFNPGLLPCSGNSEEFCGGTNVIAIYTLPGTGLIPLIPFDSALDDFCSEGDCPGNT